MTANFFAFVAFERGPKFFREKSFICELLVCGINAGKQLRTERTVRQLRKVVLFRRITHGVCFDTKKRVHIGLLIAPILTIELLLAERLGLGIWIAFCRLSVEWPAMNLCL